MKHLVSVLSIVLLMPSAASATTKAECKGYTKAVKELTGEIGLTPELTGRALLETVETWVTSQEESVIKEAIRRAEEVTAGIKECELSGYNTTVRNVSGQNKKLADVIPWMKNAIAADPCQGLVNEAIRKRSKDLDGAIVDLERSVRECGEQTWVAEATRNLAALYYERGNVELNDHEQAREKTRAALRLAEGLDEESLPIQRAFLARPAIEAGKALMDRGAFAEGRTHWESYIEIFGTPSFDILFDVSEMSQGAGELRDLRDALYQRVLACIELDDAVCISDAMPRAAARYEEESRPMGDLAEGILGRAKDAPTSESEARYDLFFDWITAWHEVDPDSYGLNSLFEETLITPEPEERLALLRMTKQCWIPMHVAELLREEGDDFIPELKVAADCGEAGAEAQRMLAEMYLQAVYEMLDRLGTVARSPTDKRAVIADVEAMLPKVEDPAEVQAIQARLANERAKIKDEAARAKQETLDMYEGCTGILATIQWNQARENDYQKEESDFRRSCCRILSSNEGSWIRWMESKPEKERLSDAQIEEKTALMREYCRK